MERRTFLQAAGLGLAAPRAFGAAFARGAVGGEVPAGPRKPVFVYNNWSAYDELSDKVVQTEALAMRELWEMARLMKHGVQFDYYVMDAFWFDKMGGYRTWSGEHWPNGPGKWLEGCKAIGIRPGMWFSTNLIATHEGRFLEPVAEWKDSVATDPNILCLFDGGYLRHLAGTLQIWYDRGVRLFKFDFAYFEAVTASAKGKYGPEEIKEKNKDAFRGMLKRFRERNPDVLITGYNGFGGEMENTFTPFHRTVDHRWLDVFDTLYCGDPRFSDVPMINIWRSQDNYSDHMVRQFEFNGLPLRRIDSCAFMIGTTGTCYYRGVHCWRGMLLLELARGGWMNVYHGNLELLSDADAGWWSKAQTLYRRFQDADAVHTFGQIPGSGALYGFRGRGSRGSVYTIVNPSQDLAMLDILWEEENEKNGSKVATRLLYADGGYTPDMSKTPMAGPEQLVVIGTGEYADSKYDLGRDDTIRIPDRLTRPDIKFSSGGKNAIVSDSIDMRMFPGWDMRIFVQQFGADGLPVRSWGGAPPDGKKMSELIQIRALQAGKALLLYREYDQMIWSGLSWGAAELRHGSYDPAVPVTIECGTAAADELRLEARVYVGEGA